MSYKTDPPRLRDQPDDMPESLGSAIDALGGAAPTPRDIDALRTNVRLALGLPLAGGPSHPPASPPAAPIAPGAAAKGALTASQWVSWVVAPLGVGAIAGAVLLGTTKKPDHPAAPAPIAATSIDAPFAREPIEIPVAPAAEPPAPAARTANAEPAPVVNRAPRANTPPSPEVPAQGAAPRVALEPAPAGYPETAPSAPSESEVSLLSRAQEALSRDPARALDLVRDHERKFDAGLLVQEREVIAVEALARLGRTKEAEARAAAFHARFPRSAHGRRIDVLLQKSFP
jgi:hypothetical protein